jgi:hypothetical protein
VLGRETPEMARATSKAIFRLSSPRPTGFSFERFIVRHYDSVLIDG